MCFELDPMSFRSTRIEFYIFSNFLLKILKKHLPVDDASDGISGHQNISKPYQIGEGGLKYLEQDLKPEIYLNIGDIPLEQNEIWREKDRILVDSYGQKIRTK